MNIEGILSKDLQDGEPTPLENIVFPYEVFPEDLNMIINELYDKLQYPKEYTAGALIFAVSVITGNTRRIELKTGYTDSASVFLINVGRAGNLIKMGNSVLIKIILIADIVTRVIRRFFLKQKER